MQEFPDLTTFWKIASVVQKFSEETWSRNLKEQKVKEYNILKESFAGGCKAQK